MNTPEEIRKELDPYATTIHVMRHGPTKWNLQRRIQGNVDTHIVEERIESYLQGIGIETLPRPDLIVITGFQRTRETAERLCASRHWSDIPLVVKEKLNERKWGIFEGKTHAEIVEILSRDEENLSRYPDLRSLSDLSPILDAPGFKVEGAESMDEVKARVEPAFLHLREELPGKKLLVIAHAGVLISLGLDHHIINHRIIRKDAKGLRIDKP